MGKYDDILNLPHHTSPKRARMPGLDRAAQFSPFAALTGFDAVVQETARLTDQKMELDENEKAALDAKLRLIRQHLGESPEVSITYFVRDTRKSGGSYRTAFGPVKKLDPYLGCLILRDGSVIPIGEIVAIEGSIFR